MSEVAKRYARAAVDAASERDGAHTVDSLVEGLKSFLESYKGSSQLRELLANPVFKADRNKALESLLARLKVEYEGANLLLALADRDRMEIIEDVVREAQQFADERANRVRAQVISAIELSAEQKDRLTATLTKRMDREVVVEVEIDQDLLGGLVCRVGDLAFDGSIKRQLELIRERVQSDASRF